MSDYFHALNGVKQGGVLSPVLFCIYIDNLLVALSKAGVGCFIGNNFVGALAYADDIVLLAPSATALRKMLQICDEFATDYSIVFNAQKSKCLVIFPQRCRILRDRLNACTFYIGCDRIEFVESFSHLGHIINAKLDDVSDIIKRRNDFIGQVNNILCYFKNLNSFVKYQLFSSYCLSMYGCELWLLNSSSISDFEVAWRKSLRKVWDLPYNTHCFLLPLLGHCLPIFDEICRRSSNFIHSCIVSKSVLVRSVALYGILFGRYNSCIGHNALFFTRRYSCIVQDIIEGRVNSIVRSYCNAGFDDYCVDVASCLYELIMVRDNVFKFSDNFQMSSSDLINIIANLSTC